MRSIPFGRPVLGDEERRAAVEVLSGHILTHGPRVKSFEQSFAEFTKAPHALAVASCTAGLHLAYLHLGIGAGDEVIAPAQSHTATGHAVEYCGAKAVFVDAEPRTGNIDLDQVEAAITDKTRAISVVHYLGLPVAMERVLDIARRHGLFVVEDCALSLGATYNGVHTGLLGDVGCFSFYPVKHITTAEGGAVITRRPDVAHSVGMLRAFGIDRNVVSERKVPGDYDVELLGLNYRMNEISAAIGVEQMKRVPEILSRRRENYESLAKKLREVDEIELFESSSGNIQSSYYCQSVLLRQPLARKRLEVMESLGRQGVGVSVYYPRPIPHMTYYRKKYGYDDSSFPVAARISASSIALPVGPHVGPEDVDYIVAALKTAIAEVKKS